MKAVIDVSEAERLIAAGAQTVEVLPRAAYDKAHLPSARSIPLGELPSRAEELRRDEPVVLYCYDMQCDISPRAAALLVKLGFTEVYDFAPGKIAWMAAGLPTEGGDDDEERAGGRADRAPTCDLADDLANVTETLDLVGLCVVVDGEGVVMGVVDQRDARKHAQDTVLLDVMDAGVRTVRPHSSMSDVGKLFERSDEEQVLVTTLTGRLLGMIRRSDLSE